MLQEWPCRTSCFEESRQVPCADELDPSLFKPLPDGAGLTCIDAPHAFLYDQHLPVLLELVAHGREVGDCLLDAKVECEASDDDCVHIRLCCGGFRRVRITSENSVAERTPLRWRRRFLAPALREILTDERFREGRVGE